MRLRRWLGRGAQLSHQWLLVMQVSVDGLLLPPMVVFDCTIIQRLGPHRIWRNPIEIIALLYRRASCFI